MTLPTIDDYPARFRFRFCPLCAAALERQHHAGRERLRCPNDGWTFYPSANLAATVVVEYDGGVVMLRRAIPPDVGIWHLPIGHLEFGEPPEIAASREVLEETGLVIDTPVFTGIEWSRSYDDWRMFYVVFCYHARAVGGSLHTDSENDAIKVFAPDALPALVWTSQQRALRAWQEWKSGQTSDHKTEKEQQ